ncbi:MAG: AtpZ/AtpI family protein [Oligoflexia bacterium]|nr:AtpZ/AtpI family protein [Oligoflexia bacterium]
MAEKEEDKRPEWAKSLGLFSVIISELVGFTGAGVAAGYWARTALHAPWWTMLVSSLMGLGLAMYRIYVISSRANASDKTQ